MAKTTSSKSDSAPQTPRRGPGPDAALVRAIEARLRQLTTAALRDELERLVRERKGELAARLRPFETPVSEETMWRSVG